MPTCHVYQVDKFYILLLLLIFNHPKWWCVIMQSNLVWHNGSIDNNNCAIEHLTVLLHVNNCLVFLKRLLVIFLIIDSYTIMTQKKMVTYLLSFTNLNSIKSEISNTWLDLFCKRRQYKCLLIIIQYMVKIIRYV